MDAAENVRQILKMPSLDRTWLLEAFTVFTNAHLEDHALWAELVTAWNRLATAASKTRKEASS